MSENTLKATAMNRTKGLIFIVIAFVFFLGVTIGINFGIHCDQQFSLLAHSFRNGHLYFLDPITNCYDMTPHNGKYYWPLGPLPAVLLMPFQFAATQAGQFFYQGYLQPFLVIALLIIIFRIARRTGYGIEDSAYLAFGFAFATAFLGVGIWSSSHYSAQVLTCVLVFAAINEITGRNRPLLVGLFFGLILATRVTAALGFIWCIGESLLANSSRQDKLRWLIKATCPCLTVLALLLIYNYVRFGNAFDQGYAEQLISTHVTIARNIGLFSLSHLPGNLYYFLLSGPSPVLLDKESLVLTFPFVVANTRGMSIFVTSPCMLYMFALKYRDTSSRLLLLTSALIALPILLYYGVGYIQFGYRYSLDFLPFLYYLLIRNYHSQKGDLTSAFKAVILVSALCNLYLFAGCFVWQVAK